MTLWMVRAGKHGEYEEYGLQHDVVATEWSVGDLGPSPSKERVRAALEAAAPEATVAAVSNWLGSLWTIVSKMQNNDLVAMPRKSVPSIAFGRITGSCEHRLGTNGESLYVHPVDWVKPDVPRTEIPAGVKGAITSFAGTACQVSAEAEGWVRSFMDGHTPPEDTELPPPVDVVAASRERISDFVGTVFHGHDLARLVEAIMQAEGYVTLSSSPGADGGVDILAGGGPLGFGSPRLCVQVKSGQAGSPVVDNLAGVMAKFGADHGLLVAWGGFTKAARDDARKQYFSLRLWDSDDLLDRLMAVYEQLNPNIQAELPLSRIWVLANDPSSF